MPTFEYNALDPGGVRITGVLGGASEQAVLAELESRRLTPISVHKTREKRERRVSPRALAVSYTQLADLLNAGVPLMRALRLLARGKSNRRLAAVWAQIAEAVSEGGELALAMGEHPRAFPSVHVAMVAAGEKGGFLEQVLERLGAFVTRQAELRMKVVGSLVYPGVLVTFGGAILIAIFGVFVPKFEPLFERLDSLPLMTEVVLGLAHAVRSYGVLIAIVAAAVVGGIRYASRQPGPARRLAELRLKLPIIGPLIRNMAAARFCRMLGTMEANGVPLIDAMRIAKSAAGDPLMEEAIDRATDAVRAGEQLAPPLGESGFFSEESVEMIAVGEAAGQIDKVLLNVADTIERRIDHLLTIAVRLIEPLLLAVIAATIAVVAASLIVPMLQLGGAA